MNILIIGTNEAEQKLIELCLKSKHLDKIFTASKEPLENIPNVEYSDYEELCQKAKALSVDIAIVVDLAHMQNSISEVFRKNKVNIICSDKKWTNLQTSRIAAKLLMQHYSINTPEMLKVPATFPVVIKTDKPGVKKIAHTMQELIEIREEIKDDIVFIEEILQGEEHFLISLWDGRSVTHFNPSFNMTEVQLDRLELYKTRLAFMLSDENAGFKGFLVSKLIWAKNDWYVLRYKVAPNAEELSSLLDNNTKDFGYLLNSIIYQKLNEI